LRGLRHYIVQIAPSSFSHMYNSRSLFLLVPRQVGYWGISISSCIAVRKSAGLFKAGADFTLKMTSLVLVICVALNVLLLCVLPACISFFAVDSSVTHARTLQPAALAFVPFGLC